MLGKLFPDIPIVVLAGDQEGQDGARHSRAGFVKVILEAHEAKEVLCLTVMDDGCGIPSSMSVRPKTVSTNRARILKKMDMKTNIELFHYATKNHLIDARFL